MKLTKRNYFSKKANNEYMSVSQYKAFKKCQAAAMAELNSEYQQEKTTALLVGSYVDAYFEGTLSAFKKQNPEIFKKDGELKSDYLQAEQIIRRIERDKLFMLYLSGKKQVIMSGEISGVPVKIKVDSLLPDKIVDLKVMRDFSDSYTHESGFMPWFESWGYDTQGAVYQEIVRQNTGKKLPFFLAAASKEKVTDICIVHMTQDALDYAMEDFQKNIVLFDSIKKGIVEAERCEKCAWCKETKVLTEPIESNIYSWL